MDSGIVVMAKEPGPHGCTVGGGPLLYHPPCPLGPGVLPSHFSLKHRHMNKLCVCTPQQVGEDADEVG